MTTTLATDPAETAWLARFSGIGRLYGDDAMRRLRSAHVAVIGIGGVGSWTAESLARTGIGEITLIDLDDICVTNVNRQLHAIEGQIGQLKVAAMKERILSINRDCTVHAVAEFFTKSNATRLLDAGFDCVVDAIDSVDHKCVLIDECFRRKIPTVVTGGAGGKSDPSKVRTDDLFYATNDRLLKLVRKKLRTEYGFPPEPEKIPFGIVSVFCAENANYPWSNGTVCDEPEPGQPVRLNCESGIGTASFVTGTFGFTAAAEAVKTILGV